MVFDVLEITRQVAALGDDMSPDVIGAAQAIYAPFHEQEPYAGVRVRRDAAYGPHERQRLDVFEAEAGGGADGGARPVVVFVHGGGFMRGDKHTPGTPYNDNVALWAVRHGLVGVNITHRLAPEFPWPAGAEDVAAAVSWVRAHAGEHGGDPERVYLMGTSAGAAHAAAYVAHRAFHPSEGPGLAGVVLLSGVYDLTAFTAEERAVAYYGPDPEQYAERSSIQGLLDEQVPSLFVLAELDPPRFADQALRLINAYVKRHGRWPRFLRLLGHNHFTATLHLNTPDDSLGRHLELADRLLLDLADQELGASTLTLTEVFVGPARSGRQLPDCCVLLAAEDEGAPGIGTFDERLGRTAKGLGLDVAPA